MLKIIIQFVLISSLLCSCINEVDIDLPAHQSRLVVGGLCLTGDTMKMYVGVSKVITDLNFELEGHPQITVESRSGIVDSFLPMEKSGWYRAVNTVVKGGELYSISVSYDGLQTVSANSYAPDSVVFSLENYKPNIGADQDGIKKSEVAVAFYDNPNERNFYEIKVRKKNKQGFYFIEPSSTDIVILEDRLNDEFYDLLFTDKLISGKKTSIVFGFFEPTGWEGDTELVVFLRNVTEDYYRYKTKSLLHYQFQESMLFDGSGSPVNMFHNITNGYGIFAGYSQTEQSILLKYDGPDFIDYNNIDNDN